MDITHFYTETGAGEPLVLLHGNGEDGGYFVHQVEPFSAAFRVIVPDTRGHGRTPRGEAPFTIRQFGEDLAGFLDKLGIEKAHILGFSDGANIAMCFASRYPNRVGKLILDGGNLNTKGVKRTTQLPIELGFRAARLFAKRSPKAKRNAEMLGLMVDQPNLTDEELDRITAETLVIAGTKDMIKEQHTRYIAGHIPHAQLVFLQGNHFVANRNPGPFNRAVLDFLLSGRPGDNTETQQKN